MPKPKNPVGRPPKFRTPEQMQKAIDAYFKDREENERPVTVSGLALHLGMTTHALRNYECKPEFLTTVKTAKQRVEEALEERLAGNAPTGSIFNLKCNFGWVDKTQVDIGATDSLLGLLDAVQSKREGLPTPVE